MHPGLIDFSRCYYLIIARPRDPPALRCCIAGLSGLVHWGYLCQHDVSPTIQWLTSMSSTYRIQRLSFTMGFNRLLGFYALLVPRPSTEKWVRGNPVRVNWMEILNGVIGDIPFPRSIASLRSGSCAAAPATALKQSGLVFPANPTKSSVPETSRF